jgi:oligopeptide transport system substrate-binding protein
MRKIVLTLIALTLVLTLFSGCKKQQTGDSFILYNGGEPESLDPAAISGVPEHRIYMTLFEGLVSYDPQTCEPVPGVAESWEVDETGTVFTFKLRDAVWSDGTPITAQTFVDSWLRFLNPETAASYAWMMNMIIKGAGDYNSGKAGSEAVQVRALDDKTFQFETTGPVPYAVGMLAHYAFACHPLHAIEKHGDSWTNVENFVGNGPFILKEWEPQSRLSAVPNPKYWDKENVKLSEVVFLPMEDNNTAMNMYINGELDWSTQVPVDRIEEGRNLQGYHVNEFLGTYYYGFNTKRKPFDDARVRKAFSMAISRTDIVEKITRGGEIPAYGMVPPMPGYTQTAGVKEDIGAAKKLLEEAGYPGGEGIEFTILYNTDERHKKIAEYCQQIWTEQLGAKVELENQEWKTYLNTREQGQFDVTRAGWVGDYLDPNTFLELFVSGSALNGGKFTNEQYDARIEGATKIRDSKKRLATLAEAEDILIKEEMAVMPIYFYSQSNLIDTNKWGGWYENTLDIHPTKNIYRK